VNGIGACKDTAFQNPVAEMRGATYLKAMRLLRLFLITVAIVAVAAAVIALVIFLNRVRLSESEARTIIVDTFLRDEPDAFVVTGTITFSTSVESYSGKRLLPGVLNLDLGTTIATVRAPGRAVYGFDASVLDGEDIHLRGDTVLVRLPPLEIFAVEPDLELLEERVEVGWARLYRSSGQTQSLMAIRKLLPAMRRLATEHLAESEYPAENTKRAVEQILGPVFRAAGTENPVFVIQIRPTVILPSG
jgi:hypothetical protein